MIFGPPWPPGTRGNPAGYSRGRRISDAIDRLTEEMALNREFGSTARRLECRQRSYYLGTEEAHTNPTRQRGECLRALAGASG